MKDYENVIKEYLEERGWNNLRPSDLAKSIVIEAAELLELFQWTNHDLDRIKKDKEVMEKIKSEIADIMNYCFNLTVLLGLDTKKILNEKLDKVKKKYPAHLFNKSKNSRDPGSEEVYLKIKKEHRVKNNK